MLSERRIHAATMVPVASAFLANLTGLFVVTGSSAGDRRLVLAGRLGLIGTTTVLSTTVAVTVSGVGYPLRQWVVFAAANLLIALVYARSACWSHRSLAASVASPDPRSRVHRRRPWTERHVSERAPSWGAFLPARGASRVRIDGAFTGRFDQLGYVVLGVAWLAAFTAATLVVFGRRTGTAWT